MELMNKAFVDCCGQLATSGLSPDQAGHVRDTETRYEALMRCVRNPDEDCSQDVVEVPRRASSGSQNRNEVLDVPEPKCVPSWMDQSILDNPRNPSADDLRMGYTLFSDPDQTQAVVPSQQHNSPRGESYPTFRTEAPVPSIGPPPRTYSFEESTFARRLHRATLEAGYQLVLDPNMSPQRLYRAFRLSLMIVDRSKLTLILKNLLERGPDDSLDSGMPMVHIGGAGTHYSRKDKFGVLQPKKQAEPLGTMGPQALNVLQHANLTSDVTVNIIGFEGEWFDPHDVEGYLAEKGIFIDPGSSFAEADAEVVSNSSTASSSATSSGTATSPDLRDSAAGVQEDTPVPHLGGTSNWQIDTDDWADFSMGRMSDIGFSDASTGSWMNFLMPGEKLRLPNTPQWENSTQSNYMSGEVGSGFGKSNGLDAFQKNKTLIDVAKFIKGKRRMIVLPCSVC